MHLNINELLQIVKKIINYFMNSYDRLCLIKEYKKKLVQIQVLLEKSDFVYKLQIVYCGKINFDIYNLFSEAFNEAIKNVEIDGTALAIVCSKNETVGYNNEETMKVVYLKDKIIFTDKKIHKSTVQTHWEEYTCVLLKNNIELTDINQFETCIKNYIMQHKPNYPKIRFVFMKDGHQIMEDSLDPDISSCRIIASSIASVIGNSRNEDFKKNCLDMWHTNYLPELDVKIFKKLLHHLENK